MELKIKDLEKFKTSIIAFHHLGETVGELKMIEGKMHFEGNVDISAKIFFDQVIKLQTK